MDSTMVVNTKLEMFDFLAMTNEMVSEFFDDNGEYQPHIGIINVARLFYNYCVTQSKFDEDIPHAITEPETMIPLMADDEFMSEFTKAIYRPNYFACDFANAYKFALDIVNTKKTSLNYAVDKLSVMLKDVIDKVAPMTSDDTFKNLSSIVDAFQNGNLNVDTLIDSYAHSQAFQDALSGSKVSDDGNLISFEKKDK